MSPVSYLIVDDSDGRVLAEYDRIEDAVRAMKDAPTPRWEPLRLVVFDDSGGVLARTESWISVRRLGERSSALRPPTRRRGRARSHARRGT
jgi:hypothetical protein